MDPNVKETTQTPEQGNKKPSRSVWYFVTVMVLSAVLLTSALLFANSWLSEINTYSTTTQKPTQATQKPTSGTKPTQTTTQKPTTAVVIDLGISEYPDEVWLVGEAAQAYLKEEKVEIVGDFLWPYLSGGQRQDVGMPVELACYVNALPEGCYVASVVFYLSEKADFSDAVAYCPEPDTYIVRVYGLYTGRQYYCKAVISLSDGTQQVRNSQFYTADTPRVLGIDGIVNVRDIGGWKTTDGKVIKQGLLYRGSELDGLNEPSYRLTEQGKQQMLEMLQIRMDMDLRYAGENVLGENVKHTCYAAIQYSDAFTDAGKDAVRRVFADLADPDNYPIYMHCTYGADRTGTMCYLLETLLGVSDADLMRDYQLTGLTFCYVSQELMDAFIQEIAAFAGDTTQEKVENFLLSVGVTPQQIESIRDIFLEEN